MLNLPIILAPNPIFRQKASKVDSFDGALRQCIADMLETLYAHKGLGLAGNMVGVLKQIIVIDLQTDGKKDPLILINPHIVDASDETQIFTEASLSYPGIEAQVRRPKKIAVSYFDEMQTAQELTAEGFLATVIQHEMDYLDGRTYLDQLSRLKKDNLLRRYRKIRISVAPAGGE
ncbi:peptide deformylase [Sneathiella marina]|uniref:Peptide deformylase-like n=1 Tax=Sneathiella marina TaxID=2950108 RepID=A0ABY4W882_9PROT|nr:peptide deformylase [Sneathiella marina]USG61960.1 peptide deformylase [Sneathiella marina]